MMREKILYGYSALFDSPDSVISAAARTVEEGYTRYDVNTPYPLHGMDSAMKLKPSKLGYFALIFGLSGALAATLMLWWMSAIDYPITIGGKPLFSYPAYIPVIFEVTVLTASIATVLTMLLFFFKFPNNSHPLHGTSYMKKVSSDKYGIVILADDPKFDQRAVRALFESSNAAEIEPVYWDEDEISHKHRILEPKFLIFLVLTAIVTSGVTYLSFNKLLYIVPFNWMSDQPKLSAQGESPVFKDGFGMRQPVAGTVARGYLPYQFAGRPDIAGEKLVNPIPVSKQSLQAGRINFDIYCSPCHGYNGDGASRLHGQFPNPPSLHSEKVKNWPDGRIFAVITEGQNIMPSYATQLNTEERWTVINYIRALQRALNAKESDLK
jgi:mono/diheme cytochrome c family protein